MKTMNLRFSQLKELMKSLKSHRHSQRLKSPIMGQEMSEKNNSRPFTVAVEGNIGSGKTTLLNYFSKFSQVEVVHEPIPKWTNCKGHNLLGLMYSDPLRWSLSFQTYVQLTMLQSHIQQTKTAIKLMERSIYSAKYCFVENLHDSGKMADCDHAVLTEWFDWIVGNNHTNIDLIVYLQTKPEVVYERIKRRSRKEEDIIPMVYLESLHRLHEDWLVKQSSFPVPAPVLVMDGNRDLASMPEVYKEYSDLILTPSQKIFV